jgi:alpha-beta hydrolase superfamily lysophospholipase
VRFQVWTPDSLALFASYYPTGQMTGPVALLLHDRGGEGIDLAPLAMTLQASGTPVFLPDLRGEGDSVGGARGRVQGAARWRLPERVLIRKDLAEILDFAAAQAVLRDRAWVLVAVGESAGIALELMQADSSFSRLALLSPRCEDDLDSAAFAQLEPVLLLACEDDEEGSAAVRALYERLPAPARRMDLLPCRARGARLLRWVKGLDLRVADWLRRENADY